jgi:hypothetical protein
MAEGRGRSVQQPVSYTSTTTAQSSGCSGQAEFDIQELFESAVHEGSASTTTNYPRPHVEPIHVDIPSQLLSRLLKSRYMIAMLMQELEEVRKEVFVLNDRLHRITVITNNVLRKMLPE